MENLLSLQHSKVFAASRFARKYLQVQKVKYKLIPLDKSTFLGPILMTVLFLTIFIIFGATATATATITVDPTSGLTTTEARGTATFTVVLTSVPKADVTFGLSSSDITEGTVSPINLTFTPANWSSPQTVTVTGVNDDVVDGDIGYTIITALATSKDENYKGKDADDVLVTNKDNELEELKEKTKELSARIDILDAARTPKMIRPNKEVEFLFDSVVGLSYSFEDGSDGSKSQDYPIMKLWVPRFRLKTRATYKSKLVDNLPKIDDRLIENTKKKQVIDINYIVNNVRKQLYELSEESDLFKKSEAEAIVKPFEESLRKESLPLTTIILAHHLIDATNQVCDRCGIEKEVELSDSQAMEYKMQAVEKVLGLQSQSNDKIIERIESAHKEIKNYEWAHDYLRFGILVNHITSMDANATSILLSAYPSYRRFMPGKVDFWRRISIFFAGGTASTVGETEAKGIVYSYGLGFDVIKGVGLAGGCSTYSFRELGSEDYKVDRSWSLGISLNSELWKGLFGK